MFVDRFPHCRVSDTNGCPAEPSGRARHRTPLSCPCPNISPCTVYCTERSFSQSSQNLSNANVITSRWANAKAKLRLSHFNVSSLRRKQSKNEHRFHFRGYSVWTKVNYNFSKQCVFDISASSEQGNDPKRQKVRYTCTWHYMSWDTLTLNEVVFHLTDGTTRLEIYLLWMTWHSILQMAEHVLGQASLLTLALQRFTPSCALKRTQEQYSSIPGSSSHGPPGTTFRHGGSALLPPRLKSRLRTS